MSPVDDDDDDDKNNNRKQTFVYNSSNIYRAKTIQLRKYLLNNVQIINKKMIELKKEKKIITDFKGISLCQPINLVSQFCEMNQ